MRPLDVHNSVLRDLGARIALVGHLESTWVHFLPSLSLRLNTPLTVGVLHASGSTVVVLTPPVTKVGLFFKFQTETFSVIHQVPTYKRMETRTSASGDRSPHRCPRKEQVSRLCDCADYFHLLRKRRRRYTHISFAYTPLLPPCKHPRAEWADISCRGATSFHEDAAPHVRLFPQSRSTWRPSQRPTALRLGHNV